MGYVPQRRMMRDANEPVVTKRAAQMKVAAPKEEYKHQLPGRERAQGVRRRRLK